ncbi:hypothetical protein [Shimia sp. MIT1388]
MKPIFQILPAALLIVGAFYFGWRGTRRKDSGKRQGSPLDYDRNSGSHWD